ncbi:MAG: T9SS type A sorting domain-containing protein [Bacteroidales bacterium]|nr:T9SS type A sorting domain-containing protein [Bacteroidales bacterium]
MKLNIFLAGVLLSFPLPGLFSQELLYEGFEQGAKPEGWTQEYSVGKVDWRYRNGGYNPSDPNLDNPITPNGEEDIARNPPSALEGNYNAFFFNQGDDNERTRLVTPELDLMGAAAVQLSFYLCQIPWTFEGATGWDVLRIYYKISDTAPWILLEEYLDPVYEWEKQVLSLPNPSETYYVAFEGQARWGFGTLVDSVYIEETGTQQLYVNDVELEQLLSPGIPSGTPDAPILRADLQVYGNTGTLTLDQVTFASLNTADADILSGGVKLYSTSSQEFTTDNLVGTPVSFTAGEAVFTSLDHTLAPGHNYLWLSYEVAPGATHKNKLDAMIRAGDIVTSGGAFPVTDLSPAGEEMIYHTYYYDGFEGTQEWDLTGEFQVGAPGGLGGDPGNPDPAAAFRGQNVLGTDLTYNGNYEANLTVSTADMATSKNMNVLYYKDLNLFFRRHLNIEVWDDAFIDVSTDDGITWEPVWHSNAYINDFQWNQEKVLIPAEYWRSDSMKFRFRMGPTNAFNNYSGWNIDDVYLTGEFIAKDVGISEWITPLSGSGLTASEIVTVRIRNYGGTAITDPVPVAYSFNGGSTWTIDAMDTDIPVDGSVEFTFSTKTNLSQPGLRPSVFVRTLFPGDQYPANDRLTTEIYVVPTYVPPHAEDFEENDGYWRSFGSGIWEYGTPAGTVISNAASGSHSWATGLSSDYGAMISGSNQSLFEDGFESDMGWSFSGEFERAMPDGIHLPWYPYYGYYSIGTDITGRGDSLYQYENGISEATAYNATSPSIDVSAYNQIQLSFARWVNVVQGDTVKVEISSDNGTNWHTLWHNEGAEIMDQWWLNYVYNIPDSLIFTDAMRIRFTLSYSSSSGEVAAGWNIDDVLLTGNPVSSEPAWLASPSFNLTGMQHPMIKANLWTDTEAGVDGMNLQYTLDGGQTWNTVSNLSGRDSYWKWYTGNYVSALANDGWSGQSGGWITVKHLLPEFLAGESDIQFRFRFSADKVQNEYNGIAMDDFLIMEAPHDADLLDIVSPVSACELGSAEQFTLTVKNAGITDISAGDSVQIAYYIEQPDGIHTKEEVYYLLQDLPVGNTMNITTGSQFDFSASGEYNITIYLQYDDPNLYSSISADTVYSTITVNKPYVEIGNVISTARPDTVVLDAYSGVSGQSYLWQDGSTDAQYHVTTNGKYWVRVINSLGCSASDTVRVVQLFPDVGVTAYSGPQSGCETAPGIPLEITVQNLGNDTLDIGNEIIVGGMINGGAPFYDTITLTQPFKPAEQFNHTYHGYFDFSATGSYLLQLFTMMGMDENADNDTLTYNLEVYGYPDASLGEDITVDALEYILSPEPGHDKYLWQDGSTGETFTIDQPGTGVYYVTVTNENLCSSSDTIEVTLNVTDLELTQLLSPSGACEFSTSFNIAALLTNKGNQVIPAGQSIAMGYSINEGTEVREQHTLSADLLPGEQFTFNFSGDENFQPDQWYFFSVFVDLNDDVNAANDAVTSLVHLFDAPPVNLGRDRVETGLTYTLDAGPDFVSYLWQDGSTNQTYTITTPGIGIYHVTVEDLNGCIASDTVRIMLSVPDIGVTEISHPQTACHLYEDEQVQVAVQNLGNWNIASLSVIYVSYVVNDGPVVTEPFPLADTLKSGEVIYHTFAKKEDMSVPGNFNIVAYTTYDDDMSPGNNDASLNVAHYGPSVEIRTDPGTALDSDSLAVYTPVTLYAQQPYSSFAYQWQDGSSAAEYVIPEPSAGWYWVKVEGDHGCTGIDSLYVAYDRPDLGIVGLASPVSTCAVNGTTPVSVEIINNGYLEISTEQGLTMTYSVNGGSSKIETFHLDADLEPGQTTLVTFTAAYDFSAPGAYNVYTSVIYEKDVDFSNNTLNTGITVWDPISVEIGNGEDTLRTALPVTLDAGSGFTSYLWSDHSAGRTIEAASYGLYWVEVTNSIGCVASDSVVVMSVTGVDNVHGIADRVRVYPNPVKDVLHVDLNLEQEQDVMVEIYSALNQLLYVEEMERAGTSEFDIDVQQFVPGIYTLRIIADGISHSCRIIVQ